MSTKHGTWALPTAQWPFCTLLLCFFTNDSLLFLSCKHLYGLLNTNTSFHMALYSQLMNCLILHREKRSNWMKIPWPSFYQIYPGKLACASIPAFLLITGMKYPRFFFFHYDLPLVIVKWPSRVLLFVTPWAVAYQAPLSKGFSNQDTEVGCHFLLQGIFPIQGLNPGLLHCRQTLLPSEPPGKSHDLHLNLF